MVSCISRSVERYGSPNFAFVSRDDSVTIAKHVLYACDRTSYNQCPQFVVTPVGASTHDYSFILDAMIMRETFYYIFDHIVGNVLSVGYYDKGFKPADTMFTFEGDIVHLDIV